MAARLADGRAWGAGHVFAQASTELGGTRWHARSESERTISIRAVWPFILYVPVACYGIMHTSENLSAGMLHFRDLKPFYRGCFLISVAARSATRYFGITSVMLLGEAFMGHGKGCVLSWYMTICTHTLYRCSSRRDLARKFCVAASSIRTCAVGLKAF